MQDNSSKPLGRPAADIARVCRLLRSRTASLGRLAEAAGMPAALKRQLERALKHLESGAEAMDLVSTASETERDSPRTTLSGLFGKLVKDRTTPDEAPAAGIHGCSTSATVAEILGFLSGTQKTGVLWVDTVSESFQIELEGGAVVYATSNDPPAGTRLGEILVSQGALEEEEVQAFLKEHHDSSEMLGSALVRNDVIPRSALEIALCYQVQVLFQRLFASEKTSYTFTPNMRLMENPDLRMNVTHLLLESARKVDEARKKKLENAA